MRGIRPRTPRAPARTFVSRRPARSRRVSRSKWHGIGLCGPPRNRRSWLDAVPDRALMVLSKAVERPFFVPAVAILTPLFAAAVLVKYGPLYAVAPLLVPVAAWFLVER